MISAICPKTLLSTQEQTDGEFVFYLKWILALNIILTLNEFLIQEITERQDDDKNNQNMFSCQSEFIPSQRAWIVLPLISSLGKSDWVQLHEISMSFLQIILTLLLFPVVPLICHPLLLMDLELGQHSWTLLPQCPENKTGSALLISLGKSSGLIPRCKTQAELPSSPLRRCFSLEPYWLLPD